MHVFFIAGAHQHERYHTNNDAKPLHSLIHFNSNRASYRLTTIMNS
jgi:hypothetical protein